MKKSIFLFFAAILCSVSAWAFDVTADYYVYFEKPSSWSNVSLLLGHGSWSQGYNMTKITNTNLYYWQTISWGGASEYYFIDATGWGGEGKSPTNRKGYASHASSKFTTNFSKYHLFNSTKSVKTSSSSYSNAVNLTQTIKVQVKDGENWVDATVVPADLKASTYALTSATAAGAKSASLTKESTTVSGTVSAAYSATVSLTGGDNPIDGYVFEGWYDANGNKITSYTVSAAVTVYARFIQTTEETHPVTVSYKCGTTDVTASITEQVGVETEKSFTAPTVTGYNFTGWTVGAGMTLKAGTVADATITVVTKSASSNYTLVANYEEVLETIYFINTGKWSVVNLHRWGGTATETAWPGEAMASTGEKIGEYDVYSFTAQQGAFAKVIFNNGSAQTSDLDWTAGKYYINNYNGNSGWYTKAEAEELLVVPAVYETVYFVNNKNWTKVQIHAWKGSVNNGWPGQALTATGEKVEGFDVYSFEAAQGTYTNLVFNNKEGDAGVQSSNFIWTADKYYYMGAAENYAGSTKEEITTLLLPDPLATDVYLAGEMNSWNTTANEFKKATAEATTASVIVNLTEQTYKFKLIIGEGNWRGNTGTMKRGGDAVHEGGWSFEEEGGDDKNCKIVADIAGDYVFTWNLETKKLIVTYPELPTYNVTATVNPAETGSVEGAKEYKQGEQATLTATPAEGYEFVNWTKGEEKVSTENPYTFAVTENVTLVANFVKNATVTVVDPIGSMSTYTGVEYDESAETWSKVYHVGDEVTIGVAQLGEGWVFAYWTVGEEKIFTEEYTFTVAEDVTITATYAMAMDVTFDNLVLDAESGLVEAGPDASYGIELILGIDMVNAHPKGYGLVASSSISLGGNELELVTGYFTAIDVDAPSAEAVVMAVYEEMLMAFVCSMTAAAAPAYNVVVENAVLKDSIGFLFMNGTWSDGVIIYPVQAEIPGFDATVASATCMVTITVGGEGDDPWLGFGEGEATVTVESGVVTLTAHIENAWTGFKADVTISGTLPVVEEPETPDPENPDTPTSVDNVEVSAAPVKVIENGQLIIIKNGVQYNAQGAILK